MNRHDLRRIARITGLSTASLVAAIAQAEGAPPRELIYPERPNLILPDNALTREERGLLQKLAIIPGMGFVPAFGGRGDGPPALGAAFGGGYYIGSITDGGTLYYLILAPLATGYSANVTWDTNAPANIAATSLTNGPANTTTLYAGGVRYAAARYARNLTIGGFTDWYLAARDEFAVAVTNMASLSGGEALTAGFYWTSTAVDNSNAYRYSTTAGSSADDKTGGNRVRAFRRVAA